MGMTQKNFKELLEFGEEGEHEVADFLINRGVKILPLYQFTPDTTPYIFSKDEKIISPDLICFSDTAFMVEVKTKNQWVEFRGVIETGIDKRLFLQYKKIQELTKIDFYVFFNHKTNEPTGFYFCKLDDYTREWDGIVKGKRVSKEMMFYNIDVLKKIST